MKLPELKNRFKNRYVIRVIAGALVVAMVGTGMSVYDVSAAKGNRETAESTETFHKEDGDTDAKNALSEALNSSITINEKEIGKEETVYVIADNTGKSKEVIVSDHLLNDGGKAELEDASTLKDITNVKGDETFTQDGAKLVWKADGNDIYYQGTSSENTPVTQELTYYLDGKEMAPGEMAGKSGEVTIRFNYTNHEKVKTEIDGKETEVCVPFVALSGMVLNDNYKNIKVTNGKVVADGNHNLVIGYTLPGLKDSLKVEEDDFDTEINIPDYFEVTADVEDFSLDMTMTVVMNANNFISAEGNEDLSGMDELFDTLTDATSQLQDGSAKLAEGVGTLKSKMGEFSDGVNTLKNGIRDYTDGASTLSNGIGTLKNGVDTLASNVPALTDGVGQLKNGADSAAAGASSLKDGAGSLVTGTQSLSAGAKGVSDGAGTLSEGADGLSAGANELSTGVQSLASGTKELQAGANTLSAGAANLNDGVGTLVSKIQGMGAELLNGKNNVKAQFEAEAGMSYEAAAEELGQLNGLRSSLEQGINAEAGGNAATAQDCYNAVNSATGSTITNAVGAAAALITVDSKINQLQAGMAKVDGAISAIDQVEATLNSGDTQAQLAALQTGAGSLAAGASNLAAGIDTLSQGADHAAQGASNLAAGAASLSGGAKELAAGAGQVSAGAEQVMEGTGQVAAGASSLSEGLGVLDAGLSALNEKAGTLGSGASQLKNGADQLTSGASTLVSNNVALIHGSQSLAEGTDAIVDGVSELDAGAHELADGIVQFNEEGIEKILNSYHGDVQPLIERIQAVIDAGSDYQSYTDIADGINGSVKFIYKTDAVKAGR